jgi:hypothetical protein
MKKVILDGKALLVEFSEEAGIGKTVVFVDDDTEVVIRIDNFDSFVNLVNMTNDMWYGRGKE